jgi:hypothetical protein
MKNSIKYYIIALFAGLLTFGMTSCEDDIDPVITELQTSRAFAPVGLEARVRNQIEIELTWTVNPDIAEYVVQFSEDNFGDIIRELSVTAEDLPIKESFAGETLYFVRVQSVAEGLPESTWATTTVTTLAEQIMEPVACETIELTSAAFNWTPGSSVTHLMVNPGNIQKDISAAEATAGEAVVDGLTANKAYTVELFNGTKRRGSRAFSTTPEPTVAADADLTAEIANAADGAVLYLPSGAEYTIGSQIIDKSITLAGVKPCNMPIIHGQLVCETTVSSITVKNIDFRGDDDQSQFFLANSGSDVSSILIEGCEISGYKNNFIYSGGDGRTFGSITITDSYVHHIAGGGGDGLDFRGGTIGSLTVENSTFANGFRTFLRMQLECATTFRNCTFYKVAIVDSGNNRGLFRSSGGGTIEVSSCLFNETGLDGTERGPWTRAGDMSATASYSNNYFYSCYNLWTGEYTDPSQVSATEADPGFVDPENGDFTVTNQMLIDNGAGDPRWL